MPGHGADSEVTVVFIDIDGTLVGDVTPQVCEWEALRAVHPQGMPAFRKSLMQHLQAGLLRPGVADCLDLIRQRYAPAELYLYTAAEATWAATIVGCIEQVTSIKFNRPIFSRKECIVQDGGRFTKSPSKLLPKVLPKLHARHPTLKLKMLQDNYIMIDNTTICAHDRSRLVLCPTYGWTDWYDCLRSVPEAKLAAGYVQLVPLLLQYGLLPRSAAKAAYAGKLKYDQFKAMFFEQLAYMLVKGGSGHKRRDDFWRVLGDQLSQSDGSQAGHHSISTRAIQDINRTLQKRFKFKD